MMIAVIRSYELAVDRPTAENNEEQQACVEEISSVTRRVEHRVEIIIRLYKIVLGRSQLGQYYVIMCVAYVQLELELQVDF